MAKLADKWGWPSPNYHPKEELDVFNSIKVTERQVTMLMEAVTLFLAVTALVSIWVATGN